MYTWSWTTASMTCAHYRRSRDGLSVLPRSCLTFNSLGFFTPSLVQVSRCLTMPSESALVVSHVWRRQLDT